MAFRARRFLHYGCGAAAGALTVRLPVQAQPWRPSSHDESYGERFAARRLGSSNVCCETTPAAAQATSTSKRKRVVCIGAGAAGLVCAKELLERGFEVDVLESREGIGGVWRFDGSGSHVGVRTGQRATSSKYYLGFSDFPIPPEAQEFPGHEAYLDYLNAYAEKYKVAERIRFKHVVKRVRRIGDLWEVDVDTGRGLETLRCDAVAVCSGLHRQPDEPLKRLRANFTGRVVHARDLKDAGNALAGKRIVVVGGGETGAELAHVAASVGAKPAIMSLRRGVTTIGSYLPLPLSGRVPDMRTPPVDLNERRLVSMLPEAWKSFVFTQAGVFELRDSNPGKYTLARVGVSLAGAVVGCVEAVLVGLSAVGGAAVSVFSTVSHPGFWDSSVLPFRTPDGVKLAAEMQASVAGIVCQNPGPMSRDTGQLASYMHRAADFRLRGYTAAHYQEVRSLLEEYTGARHTGNFLTKSDDFIYNLMEGSLKLKPGISSFDGSNVVFDDGSREEADVVVCCTGYGPQVPFMEGLDLDLGAGGSIDPAGQLYKRVFSPQYGSSLGFIGFARPQIGAMPPIAELQARWFAAVLAGEAQLPDTLEEVQATIAKDSEAYEAKVFAGRLRASVDFAKYTKELAVLAGCYPDMGLRALISTPLLWRAFWFGPVLPQAYRLGDGGERGAAARAYLEAVYVTFFTRG